MILAEEHRASFEGRTAVVFGGCGLLGGSTVQALADLGARVRAFDLSLPCAAHAVEGVTYLAGDIVDADAVNSVIVGADMIFAFAGGLGGPRSLAEPVTDLRSSCEAQIVLLEAMRMRAPDASVVFPGSRLEYGHAQGLPVSESHPLCPTSPYAVSKSACAAYYRLYHDIHGLHTVVLRLSPVYGDRPRGAAEGKGFGVLNIFVDRAMAGDEIAVWGDGSQIRDYLHVDDAISAALLAAVTPASSGRVFNIGSGERVTVREAAEAAVQAAGSGSVRTDVPWPDDAAMIETGDFCLDVSLAREMLGWEPKIGMREGVRRLVERAREQLPTVG